MGRVALIGENSIGYVDTLVDIWNNGDCAVLIDWRIPLQTATDMMHEANVHTCYIEKRLFDKAAIAITENISFVLYERKKDRQNNYQNQYTINPSQTTAHMKQLLFINPE